MYKFLAVLLALMLSGCVESTTKEENEEPGQPTAESEEETAAKTEVNRDPNELVCDHFRDVMRDVNLVSAERQSASGELTSQELSIKVEAVGLKIQVMNEAASDAEPEIQEGTAAMLRVAQDPGDSGENYSSEDFAAAVSQTHQACVAIGSPGLNNLYSED